MSPVERPPPSQSPLERVLAAAPRLKVFPLPSVVLFPGTAVPLHIFEPRYRQMVSDAYESDGVFAMANVPAHAVPQLQGAPTLHPMLCVGVISLLDQMPDGRSNLVLTGVTRAKVTAEHERLKLYREVQAEVLHDGPGDADLEAQLQRAVLELSARIPPKASEQLVKVCSRLKGGALADVVAATVVSEVPERLALLDELNVDNRLKAVLREVSGLLARLEQSKKSGGYVN